MLAGQPPLATRLTHPDLVQLRQRLAIITGIQPLTREEVCAYVEHRLNIAGCDSRLLFTRDALALVAGESKGIPRNINILCYNALALGCAQKRELIDIGIVKHAASDLALEEQTKCVLASSAHLKPRDHNNSWLRGGTTKQRGPIIVSTKRGQPAFSALAKLSIKVAMLLIIIEPLESSRARPKIDSNHKSNCFGQYAAQPLALAYPLPFQRQDRHKQLQPLFISPPP